MQHKHIKTGLKLLFIASAITLIGFNIDFDLLLALFAKLSLPFFIIVVLIAFLDQVIMGFKWNYLLRTFDIHVPFSAPILAYLRGRVFTLVAPSTLGIDAYKIYFLKKHYQTPLSLVGTSIVIERFLGAYSSLVMISLLSYFSLTPLFPGFTTEIHIVNLVAVVSVVSLLYILLDKTEWIGRIKLSKRIPQKISSIVQIFLANVAKIRRHNKNIWLYVIISTLEKVSYGSAIYFSGLALGLNNASFLFFIATTPLLALLERLPISISAIGIREGLFVMLFAPFYDDVTIAISVALIMRASEIVQIILLSFVWLIDHKPESIKETLKNVERQTETR